MKTNHAIDYVFLSGNRPLSYSILRVLSVVCEALDKRGVEYVLPGYCTLSEVGKMQPDDNDPINGRMHSCYLFCSPQEKNYDLVAQAVRAKVLRLPVEVFSFDHSEECEEIAAVLKAHKIPFIQMGSIEEVLKKVLPFLPFKVKAEELALESVGE